MAHPALIWGLIGLGAAALVGLLKSRKKVFVSYYYDEDRHYKNLLVAWAKNKKFDFEFEDVSADTRIRTDDAATLRRALSRKIGESHALLVLVGAKSHRRKWIRWEIQKARQLGKKIVAIKIKSHFQSPKSLLSCGAVWARSFEFDAVKEALESA
jgi:hypothetical protein